MIQDPDFTFFYESRSLYVQSVYLLSDSLLSLSPQGRSGPAVKAEHCS